MTCTALPSTYSRTRGCHCSLKRPTATTSFREEPSVARSGTWCSHDVCTPSGVPPSRVDTDEPFVKLRVVRLVGQVDGVGETDQLIAQILDPIECFPFLVAAGAELA